MAICRIMALRCRARKAVAIGAKCTQNKGRRRDRFVTHRSCGWPSGRRDERIRKMGGAEIDRAPCVFFAAVCSANAATRPGIIRVEVDATQVPPTHASHAPDVPVEPGPLTLLFPEWIPGEHMPEWPDQRHGRAEILAGRKPLPWRRDLLDMFAFHLTVPGGSHFARREIRLSDFGRELRIFVRSFVDGLPERPELEPGDFVSARICCQGSDVRSEPETSRGWKFGTALPGAKQTGDTITFDPSPLSTLVDSPVLAGRFFRVIPIGQDSDARNRYCRRQRG